MPRVLDASHSKYVLGFTTHDAGSLAVGDIVALTGTLLEPVLFVDDAQSPAVHVLFGDGSIHTYSATDDVRVLSAISNPDA